MQHLVILNPFAGRGRPEATAERIGAAFESRGLAFELVPTTSPGHARTIVDELGPGFDAVVVVGGDGTLHETIQGMDLDRQILGIIPWGTGNDLAWMQAWSGDLEACVDRIAARRERRIDLGWWKGTGPEGVKEARFHINVGLGFLAVVNDASHRIRWARGAMVYVLALLGSLPRLKPYPVRIEWDDGSFSGEVAVVAVGNGKRVGGTFLLAPDAAQDDGRLDLVFPRSGGLLRLLSLLPGTLRGTHVSSPVVTQVQTTRIRLRSPEGIPVYVDGEFVGHRFQEAEFGVLPGALRMF